ncbi:lysoplasmalogenase [Pseudoxanthomonas sp. PXM02]|uniref:lysoplasmalogenase n=1 Tax=Pseudoxanthomonas sp. PXM02 TaxID=2769294 RepID=UPI001785150B|nr:lysoplasmalogenase [Pseudoxanthomonas sp. PXM02]MBD9479972.1 lysoplasmalogenase [Pseudoxanthomonas sp. PXM02]
MARDGSRYLWTSAIVASAVLAIVGAEIAALRGLHYAFKPLTTLLILAMAFRLSPAGSAGYRRLIVVGLLLSTLGDVFLMLPFDGFVFGLGSFLLAHIAYLVALRKRGGWWRVRWPLFAYAVVASLVLTQLWPGLPGDLKLPVIVYVIALAGMAAQAASVWREHPGRATRVAAIGGAFFVASDALLALDRFSASIPMASVWVLTTYWVAQWCIACSVRSGERRP